MCQLDTNDNEVPYETSGVKAGWRAVHLVVGPPLRGNQTHQGGGTLVQIQHGSLK